MGSGAVPAETKKENTPKSTDECMKLGTSLHINLRCNSLEGSTGVRSILLS